MTSLEPIREFLIEIESWQDTSEDDAEAVVTTLVTGLRLALNKADVLTAPPVTVTDAMVERAAEVLNRSGYPLNDWRRQQARAALTAALTDTQTNG